MSYPGTYLKTEPFNIRYKIVANYLKGKIKKPVIVDINCGEPNFRKYIDYGKYYANDIFQPDDVGDINFLLDTDTAVDVKPDILCVFGYGGGEFTGQELESKTVGETILKLAKYNPRYIIVESAQKWEDDYKLFTNLNLLKYKLVYSKKINIEPVIHYHNKRLIKIYESKNLNKQAK